MNTGGEAAEQIVRMSLEGFEVAAKITGAGAKNIAILLYSILKEEKKTKGKARLTNMLRSGKELKVFTVRKGDLPKFTQEAKKYGVLYCVLADRKNKDPNAEVDVIARAEDASKISRIVERFNLASVDTASIVTEAEKSRDAKDTKDAKNGKEAKDTKDGQPEPDIGVQEKAEKEKLMDALMGKPTQKEESYSFIGFFIASLGISHSAYLLRNLMVKQRALSSVIGLTVSGLTGVTLAYFGFSYWGIATQSIVYVTINTACYWHFTRWRPSLQFNFTPIKEMFGFSGKLLVTNVFNHINNNLFSVILGKFYSEKEVGYYNQANKWCGMGQLFISGMINGVAQPVLTKVSDDLERQKRVFRKMLRFTAFVSFPAMLGLGIVSEELIIITITDKWYSSILIMQILCISGAFAPIAYLYQQLIISKGKSRIYMWNTIALGIILLSSVLLAHSYGIFTMLTVYVSINILWLLTWHYFVWQEIGLKLRHALMDILPYAAIAATVMVITYYTTRSIENIYLRLASKIVLAAALYVAAMWGSRSVTFKESIQYFIKKKTHEPK